MNESDNWVLRDSWIELVRRVRDKDANDDSLSFDLVDHLGRPQPPITNTPIPIDPRSGWRLAESVRYEDITERINVRFFSGVADNIPSTETARESPIEPVDPTVERVKRLAEEMAI